METIFYLFLKMKLEKLKLIINQMGEMSEREGNSKMDVNFLDPSKIDDNTLDDGKDFFNSIKSPVLSCNFSVPGRESVFSFYVGLDDIKVCDSELKSFYSNKISKDSASFALVLFKESCANIAYMIGRKSIFDKKLSIEKTLRELDSKVVDKDVAAIKKWKDHLSIANKKLEDFDKKFSKYHK